MIPRRWPTPFLLFLAVLFAAGCGGTPSSPAVYPVRGQVRFEGRPAAGVLVVFHPAQATGSELRANGKTGADGSFALSTHEPQDGALPGAYKITLLWPPTEDEESLGLKDKLGSKYSDPARTPFSFEVQAGPNEVPTLEVK